MTRNVIPRSYSLLWRRLYFVFGLMALLLSGTAQGAMITSAEEGTNHACALAPTTAVR